MLLSSSAFILAGLLGTGAAASGGFYLGASQINIEGGYSGKKWNGGLGIRAFAYGIDRPARFASNGDVELTGYYLQKRFGMAKLQFGHAYHGTYIYDRHSGRLDYGSEIGLVKTGAEAVVVHSMGVYWDCIPLLVDNFNLFEWGSRDFNRIDIGFSHHKIGIRLYL